jgi:hypothetical protein
MCGKSLITRRKQILQKNHTTVGIALIPGKCGAK